jgi:tripartite-type tricarboxylate transporter receptor subunit TctC
MHDPVRRIALCCALAALAMAPLPAAAQGAGDFPSKPVRIVVPFPPGGAADVLARLYGQKLSEGWGKPVIVENRPGAGGIIGTDAVAKAAPDGYTLLVITIGHAVNTSMYAKLPYDALKDLAPVGQLATLPSLVVVNPSVPAKNIEELVALARSKPGQLTYSSSGTGSTSHMSAALLASMTGTTLTHVPYKGAAAALNDVIGGQVQITIDTAISAVPQVKNGKLRALAVTSAKRSPTLPDLPTVAESGVPGYDFAAWYALLAPAGTPPAVIERINQEVRKAGALADVKDKLGALGAEATVSSPAELDRLLRAETARWAKVVKEQNIRAD